MYIVEYIVMIPLAALTSTMGDSIYNYYSQPHRQTGGSFTPYKAGWRPAYQSGRGWMSSLGNFLKPMATNAAKNIGKAVSTVAPVVGKKLVKIGMRSLKDWANQKQLNEAIQSNLRQAASETADEYLDKPPAQTGNGRRRRKRRHTLVAIRQGGAGKKRDCFSKRSRL